MATKNFMKVKNKRLKGVVIAKPFMYGNTSFWLGKNASEEHSHRWTVYVRGLENEDLSYFVKKVVFHLHQSFPDPTRSIEKPPFEIVSTGWGEFQIMIKIYFHDTKEPPVTVYHLLKLFPDNGQPQSVKKPVIVEHYDEFVFVNPLESFHKSLIAGPSQKFEDHPLNPYFLTNDVVEQEQRLISKISSAQAIVDKSLDTLRMRLFEVEKEISTLRGQVKNVPLELLED